MDKDFLCGLYVGLSENLHFRIYAILFAKTCKNRLKYEIKVLSYP